MSNSTLKVIAFPGAPNLPIFAAMEHGYFAEGELTVDLSTTPSSVFQFEKLAAGAYDIAMTAYDNAVAYIEGVGAVKMPDDFDVRVIMGATQLELSFITAPDVKGYEDVKGKTLAMDALYTGFAFVLYEMLARGGLTKDDYKITPVGATPERWDAPASREHRLQRARRQYASLPRVSGRHRRRADVARPQQG
jgi:ABC-type nitrate/sulfonate/bicarbonate transport system substrate-binding protein